MNRARPRSDPDMAAVDRLAARARQAEPPPLDPARAERMLDAAMAAGAAPRFGRARAGWMAIAAALLIAALGGLWRGGSRAPESRITRLELPSGDRLVAAAGASFRVTSADRAKRVIALNEGAMLFDVAPLGPGTSFEVRSGGTRVTVRGTVFSVETVRGQSLVRVYEGRVAVERGGVVREIRAGQRWSSAPRLERQGRDDLLAGEAARATARRRLSPPSAPVAAPAIAAGPAPATPAASIAAAAPAGASAPPTGLPPPPAEPVRALTVPEPARPIAVAPPPAEPARPLAVAPPIAEP